jgi:hypothetical protein
MKKRDTSTPQKMDACEPFCPNLGCESRGQIGQGNIVGHGSKVLDGYETMRKSKIFQIGKHDTIFLYYRR